MAITICGLCDNYVDIDWVEIINTSAGDVCMNCWEGNVCRECETLCQDMNDEDVCKDCQKSIRGKK